MKYVAASSGVSHILLGYILRDYFFASEYSRGGYHLSLGKYACPVAITKLIKYRLNYVL